MYSLSHLASGKIDDIENRKLLINALVNSVYVHQDDDGGHRLKVIFNVNN
jgi:hypothetical protein